MAKPATIPQGRTRHQSGGAHDGVLMEGSSQELHIAGREFWRLLRRHPKIAIAALVVRLAEESFSHRFFEWLNHTIDDHGLRAMGLTLDSLIWLSGNPLGITGIVVILVLLLTFIHSYISVAYSKKAATAAAGRILTLAVIVGGVAMSWRFTADQSLPVRLVLGLLIWGAIGAAMNEGFLRMAEAQGTSSREALATALTDLATTISNMGPVVIGSQSIAQAGPGSSGTVIGSQSIATAKPGFSGTVIGSQSIASASGTPINASKSQALRSGAERVRAGQASRVEIEELIGQSFLPGINPALNAAMTNATKALQASDLQ
jgi:hypothetical protein